MPSAHRGDSGLNRRLLDNALKTMSAEQQLAVLEQTLLEAAEYDEDSTCKYYLDHILRVLGDASQASSPSNGSRHREYLRRLFWKLPSCKKDSRVIHLSALKRKMLELIVRGFNPATHEGESIDTITFMGQRCTSCQSISEMELVCSVVRQKFESLDASLLPEIAWWIENGVSSLRALFIDFYVCEMNALRTYADVRRDLANEQLIGDFAEEASPRAQHALSKYAEGLLAMENELQRLIESMNPVKYTKIHPDQCLMENQIAGEVTGYAMSPDSFNVTLSLPDECSENDAYAFATAVLRKVRAWHNNHLRAEHIDGDFNLHHTRHPRSWTIHKKKIDEI